MANVFNYLKKYGNVSFEEKEFNEIDDVILACLSYIDFKGIVSPEREYVRLDVALSKFLEVTEYKEYLKHGLFQKDLYKYAKEMLKAERYNKLYLYNYINKITDDEQFAAITIRLSPGVIYISFEGTEEDLIGWREDGQLAYQYPIPAQKDAIKYLNKTINFSDRKVYVGGHSKGGNLALVAAMNTNLINFFKIKHVSSFDGPGLLPEQLKSFKFKKLSKKYMHYIPNYSMVGILMYNINNPFVIKASRVDLYAHSLFNWNIIDDKFEKVPLSNLSKNLQKSTRLWLSSHSYEDRYKIVNDLFNIFDELGFKSVMDLMKVKNIIKFMGEWKRFDESSKKLFKNFVRFNVEYVWKNKKNGD